MIRVLQYALTFALGWCAHEIYIVRTVLPRLKRSIGLIQRALRFATKAAIRQRNIIAAHELADDDHATCAICVRAYDLGLVRGERP